MSIGLSLQLTASVMTVAHMWFTGHKAWYAPLIALGSTIPWTGMILWYELWAMLPLEVLCIILYSRAAWLWWRDAHA